MSSRSNAEAHIEAIGGFKPGDLVQYRHDKYYAGELPKFLDSIKPYQIAYGIWQVAKVWQKKDATGTEGDPKWQMRITGEFPGAWGHAQYYFQYPEAVGPDPIDSLCSMAILEELKAAMPEPNIHVNDIVNCDGIYGTIEQVLPSLNPEYPGVVMAHFHTDPPKLRKKFCPAAGSYFSLPYLGWEQHMQRTEGVHKVEDDPEWAEYKRLSSKFYGRHFLKAN